MISFSKYGQKLISFSKYAKNWSLLVNFSIYISMLRWIIHFWSFIHRSDCWEDSRYFLQRFDIIMDFLKDFLVGSCGVCFLVSLLLCSLFVFLVNFLQDEIEETYRQTKQCHYKSDVLCCFVKICCIVFVHTPTEIMCHDITKL